MDELVGPAPLGALDRSVELGESRALQDQEDRDGQGQRAHAQRRHNGGMAWSSSVGGLDPCRGRHASKEAS